MSDWQADKQWADRFLPQIKRILGEHLISTAPMVEDQTQNTDLLVLTMAPFRIACRIRKNKYFNRYGQEFTIRAGRPGGTETELRKIIKGWGDYFFYAFCDGEERNLAAWRLADLKVFRAWVTDYIINTKAYPGVEMENGDGSSTFRAFRWKDMPTGCLVAFG